MKTGIKLFILITLFLCGLPLKSEAHRINNYKYIIIKEQGNQYGLEDRFNKYFSKIGFTTLTTYDLNNLANNEKPYVLYGNYECIIRVSAQSSLILTLQDLSGTTVWGVTESAITFSVDGDMKKAAGKIFDRLKELDYHFEPTTEIEKPVFDLDLEIKSWSEDSIKNYLTSNVLSSVEGIYKNLSNDGSFLRLAILKENEKFYGVVLESDNTTQWNNGDIVMILNQVGENSFDTEYANYFHVKLNAVASFNDGLLEIITQGDESLTKQYYFKTFPKE